MKKPIALILLYVVFVVGSCATGGVGYRMTNKNLGKEKIVESNGKRPDWAIDKPMFVENHVLYASAIFSDAPNLSKGLMVANKLAQTKIVESIRTRLRNDFTYASEGLTVEQGVLEQILTTTTDEMIVSGFFQNKQYYEKKEVVGPSGFTYTYDCYALAEITKENYMKALDESFAKNSTGVSEAFRKKVENRQRDFFSHYGKIVADGE